MFNYFWSIIMSFVPALPLPVIMTMSQQDLNYITQNGGSVGAVGSFSGDAICPVHPINPCNIMVCNIDPQFQIQPVDPNIYGCPFKIVIGNAEFGINVH
jgi:hypothetical protein